jgi:hypothetical protein
VIAAQGVKRLPELDGWYRDELPAVIAGRKPPYVTLDELVRVTQWKMARGIWRPRNLALVQGNAPERVARTRLAVAALAELAGVGPATASAVAAAAEPQVYPFFDELVCAQVPNSGPVAYTLGYYERYAAALRERAKRLGHGWTPVKVERALWAHIGGKAAARRLATP